MREGYRLIALPAVVVVAVAGLGGTMTWGYRARATAVLALVLSVVIPRAAVRLLRQRKASGPLFRGWDVLERKGVGFGLLAGLAVPSIVALLPLNSGLRWEPVTLPSPVVRWTGLVLTTTLPEAISVSFGLLGVAAFRGLSSLRAASRWCLTYAMADSAALVFLWPGVNQVGLTFGSHAVILGLGLAAIWLLDLLELLLLGGRRKAD